MAEPALTPTRPRTLVLAALLGAAVAFLWLTVVTGFDLTVPEVPWATPVLLAAAAAAGAVLARVTHVRNHVVQRPGDPTRSVATLAIARAMMLGGALLGGGYLLFGLYFVPTMQAVSPRERVLRGLVTAAVAVLVVAAGWAVERACQAPRPPDDQESPTS